MQDRYVGDVGDYVKLSLLRALSPDRRLGVAWWLQPDEDHNKDGRHIAYLDLPDTWRPLDPDSFDALAQIVASGRRNVIALEQTGLLPDAMFVGEQIPARPTPSARRTARDLWFSALKRRLADCDLLFLDPDNGLEPKTFSPGKAKAGKSVSLAEIAALKQPGRAMIIYHHHTRMVGGHELELDHWGERFRDMNFTNVSAFRAPSYSPRAFFMVDADELLEERAERLALHWGDRLRWRRLQ